MERSHKKHLARLALQSLEPRRRRPPLISSCLPTLLSLPLLLFLVFPATPLSPSYADLNCNPPPTPNFIQSGLATHYGYSWAGRRTASGKILDPSSLQAAHRTLPFGTYVCVTNPEETTGVIVEIVDRGPYGEGRIIDLTPAAFEHLAPPSRGVIPVIIQALPSTFTPATQSN